MELHGLPCNFAEYVGFSYYSDDNYSESYAGISFSEMRGDETKDQFKQRVYDTLSKIFGIPIEKIDIQSWAWYG